MLNIVLLLLGKALELSPPDLGILGGLALLPFAIGNMLPNPDEMEDPPGGQGNKEPSTAEAVGALEHLKSGKAEEGEETFETEADRQAKAKADEETRAAAEKTPEAAVTLDGRKLLEEFEKVNPALKGRFKDLPSMVKTFSETQALLARVGEHYGISDSAMLLNGLLSVNVKAAQTEEAGKAAKAAEASPAAKPAELSEKEKVFAAKLEKEVGLNQDDFKELKSLIVESLLSDPAVKNRLMGDLAPKLERLEAASTASRWDSLWTSFQSGLPLDKYPEMKDLTRAQLEYHLKQFPELSDLALRRNQNNFEIAAIDMINNGGLVELLDKARKSAHTEGAEAAGRLEKAEHASGKIQGGKETHAKPEPGEEDETPDDVLKKGGMTEKDAENWLLGRK